MNLPAFETTADGKPREHLEPGNVDASPRYQPSHADAVAHARILIKAIDHATLNCIPTDGSLHLREQLFTIGSRVLRWYDTGAEVKASPVDAKTFANSRAAETKSKITNPNCEKCGVREADAKVNSYWCCSSCACAVIEADDTEAIDRPRLTITDTGPIPHADSFASEMRLLAWVALFVLLLIVVFIAFNLC